MYLNIKLYQIQPSRSKINERFILKNLAYKIYINIIVHKCVQIFFNNFEKETLKVLWYDNM